MRYKPYFLPQLNAPFEVILEKLDDEDIRYSSIECDPNELKPSQGVIFSDGVGGVNLDDNNPIWISQDKQVLDGHHRMIRALLDNVLVKCVMVDMEFKDACRILNKIQDIYDYEKSQGMEEVESQDAINFYGDDENQFLNTMEEDNTNIQTSAPTKNGETLIGYRKDPINDNSVVGNFFTLKPVVGYDKYEIEFENLMDTNKLGVTYKDSQEPVDILAKSWFPHVNFEELSKQHNTTSIKIKMRAVAEKAMKLGYDGIKYGDTIIQGLK